jgi:hypothetical protein
MTILEILGLAAVAALFLVNRSKDAQVRAYRDDCIEAQRRLAEERRANRRPWYASRSVEAN